MNRDYETFEGSTEEEEVAARNRYLRKCRENFEASSSNAQSGWQRIIGTPRKAKHKNRVPGGNKVR